MGNSHRESGTTFVETLISIAIVLIVVGGLLLFTTTLSRSIGGFRRKLEATREVSSFDDSFRLLVARINPPYWASSISEEESERRVLLRYVDGDSEKTLDLSISSAGDTLNARFGDDFTEFAIPGTDPSLQISRDVNGIARGIEIDFFSLESRIRITENFPSQVVSVR